MFPAFAHFRRTATCDTELHGRQIREGEKVVMWYVSSNRDETRHEDPDRFDVRRTEEHQAFGAGGRHFCLGTALARLELQDPVRGDPRPLPRDGAGGPPDDCGVGVHQPAQVVARAVDAVGGPRVVPGLGGGAWEVGPGRRVWETGLGLGLGWGLGVGSGVCLRASGFVRRCSGHGRIRAHV